MLYQLRALSGVKLLVVVIMIKVVQGGLAVVVWDAIWQDACAHSRGSRIQPVGMRGGIRGVRDVCGVRGAAVETVIGGVVSGDDVVAGGWILSVDLEIDGGHALVLEVVVQAQDP